MRILIDLQGAQTSGSRYRGIGRYSLAITRSLAELAPSSGHSVEVLLNAAFPEAAEEVRAELETLLPPEAMHMWRSPEGAKGVANSPTYRAAVEILHAGVVSAIAPDALLITSLFEGFGDCALSAVKALPDAPLTAVILYDLIPFIQHKEYLSDPGVAAWYYRCVAQLRRADLFLAISESARREGVEHLSLNDNRTIAISTAANPVFTPGVLSKEEDGALRDRYGLKQQFVMYTGGIDTRKNIDALIRAYALLPDTVRGDTTLAVVCAATTANKRMLNRIGAEAGLAEGELKITGYVPEPDLLALYRSCTLFVFPSLHEGFGLPVLEAMACGAAVIASDRSSLPEVVGDARALFDPTDDQDIADKMLNALTQSAFQTWLKNRAVGQAALFSWKEIASKTLSALEESIAPKAPYTLNWHQPRKRLAMVSPVPPQRSGIAYYTAELIPELSLYYDVDFVTVDQGGGVTELDGVGTRLSPEEFSKCANEYDHIVYQFGNSEFHAHMPELIAQFPGTVVLHDVWLSGMAHYKEVAYGTVGYWTTRLRDGHGYRAAAERLLASNEIDIAVVKQRYACNVDAFRFATRIIVHSEFASTALVKLYGPQVSGWTHVVPLLRRPKPPIDVSSARKRFGFAADDFVVCTFGGVDVAKMHDTLVKAWFASRLATDRRCRLVIVGGYEPTPFFGRLRSLIAKGEGGERVSITGYVTDEAYDEYVALADAAVQLRGKTHGETSAAIMDCLTAGVATVISTGAAFSEISNEAARKLPLEFKQDDLVHALEWLLEDEAGRLALGRRARELMRQTSSPIAVGRRYREILESPSTNRLAVRTDVIRTMARSLPSEVLSQHANEMGSAVSDSLPIPVSRPRMLIDVSGVVQHVRSPLTDSVDDLVKRLLADENSARSAIPFVSRHGQVILPQNYTFWLLEVDGVAVVDETIQAQQGDVCIAMFMQHADSEAGHGTWERFHTWGVPITVLCSDAMLEKAEEGKPGLAMLMRNVAAYSSLVIVDSPESAKRLSTLFSEVDVTRYTPLDIVWSKTRAIDPITVQEVVARGTRSLAMACGGRKFLTFPQKVLLVRAGSPMMVTGQGAFIGNSLETLGKAGFLFFGPWLRRQPGYYQIRCYLAVVDQAGGFLEVVCEGGTTVLGKVPVSAQNDTKRNPLVLAFELKTPTTDIEVRVAVTARTRVRVSYYEFAEVDPGSSRVVQR